LEKSDDEKKREIIKITEGFAEGKKWVIRVVVCEMTIKANKIIKKCANIFSEYGLVHLAIQVGPYLIDWLSNSEVRIRRIFDTEHAFLFIYPNNVKKNY